MEILTYRAFTTATLPNSGNPAGVVIDAEGLEREEMIRIAADLGFSETAFLTEITPMSARVRYFTPRDEIAFCGDAACGDADGRGHLREPTGGGSPR